MTHLTARLSAGCAMARNRSPRRRREKAIRRRRQYSVERLEARVLLAVDFSVRTLGVPINQPDIELTPTSFNFPEPLLRVNPTDPGNVVVTTHSDVFASVDGGGSFAPRQAFPTPGGATNSGDTAMDFDSQGRLFWANLANFNPPRSVATTQIAPNDGTQIGATTVIPNPNNRGDDKPYLAADRNTFGTSPFADNLYTTWARFGDTPGEFDIVFSRSTDQGATWSGATTLSNFGAEGFTWPSTVAVGPNGDVFVGYHSQPDLTDAMVEVNGSRMNPSGIDGQIFLLRSTDGGVTFPQKTTPFGPGEADITFNAQDAGNGGALLGTQFWMLGAGQPWVLPDPTRPEMIYVVANDDPDDVHGVGDDGDVVIATSADNGQTWSTATIPDGASGAHQLFPYASIDVFGNIAVAWYDTRRGLTNGNGNFLLDVYATYSGDGGQTWASPFMVNDPGNPFDPDVDAARRFPTPQTGSCDATPGSTETCRIGEYYAIDNYGGTAYVAWNGNNYDGGGNPIDQTLYYSSFAIGGSATIDGDTDGVPNNDNFTVRAVAGSPEIVEVFTDLGGVNEQRLYAGLLEGVAGGLTISGHQGDDSLTIDYTNGDPVPDGGIHFDGGDQDSTPGDQLAVIGDGNNHGWYLPSSITPGDGTVNVDGKSITFTGLEPVTVSDMFEFTLITPNSNDVVTVDSPAAGQNRVSGTSGNVAFEALTFFAIDHFKMDTATHDGPLAASNDSVSLSSDLVAAGLLSMTIETGMGNDVVNAAAITTGGVTGVTILAGDGDDTLDGGALIDRIEGGNGNDTIDAGPGDDMIFGGHGADTNTWNNGDNSDIFEGGEGNDLQIVNGAGNAAAGEIFEVRADGVRVEVERTNLIGFTVDMGAVEQLDLNTGDSSDDAERVTVHSLLGTALQVLNVNGGDDEDNSLVLNGTHAGDTIDVGPHPTESGDEQVLGLGPIINIFAFSGSFGDSVTVNGREGNDSIKADAGINLGIVLNGDEGDDFLSADAVISGGRGNDFIIGGVGPNLLQGNDGDDTFLGGAGDDDIDGGDGFDTILIEGTPGDDIIDVDQTSPTSLTYVVNAVSETDTISDIEQARIEAGQGDDAIQVNIEETLGTSLRFSVDGGPNSGADVLTFVDDGAGDRILLRQAPDNQSGTIYPDSLGSVVYERMNELRFTPVNTITGGTGDDGAGRIVVLDQDPFEFNGTLPNATDVGALASAQHNPTVDLPGDEDWYHFRAPKIGTFSFEILFDRIATLPGAGELTGAVYRENGTLIASSTDSADGDVVSFSAARLEDYYLRVRGDTTVVINVYDVNLIEVDLVGLQVFDPDGAGPLQAIQIAGEPTFNLFDVKGSNGLPQGPTPAVDSIEINLQDILNRMDNLPLDLFNRPVPNGGAPGDLYPALDPVVAGEFGHYELRGDHNGIIAIQDVIVNQAAPVAGQIPTATVELVFFEPLPDDRFTLTIFDTLLDPAGNALDGNSNANQPLDDPAFPSGDNVSGGDFVARFTVDTRAELGVWASGSVYVDTNGNSIFDPEGKDNDDTNEDIVYVLGYTTDNIVAGNFAANPGDTADGFDKLGAYGIVSGQFRWLIDTDNDGVPNLVVNEPAGISGLPVAGNFDANGINGDEVGLKVGKTWWLDTNHDWKIDLKINGNIEGLPIVGDFDGDGKYDLGGWADDVFQLDLSSIGGINGRVDPGMEFAFGFIGVRERPIVADFNGDEIDDIGLWVPDRSGGTPEEQAEWYILVSGDKTIPERIVANPNPLVGGRLVDFTPEPFGNDVYAQLGDEFALPVVGNFDPPVTGDAIPQYEYYSYTNPVNQLDVDGSGHLSALDALMLLEAVNANGSGYALEAFRSQAVPQAPFYDVSGNFVLSALDVLMVVNGLNVQAGVAGGGEGEAWVSIDAGATTVTTAAPVDPVDVVQEVPTGGEAEAVIDAIRLQTPGSAAVEMEFQSFGSDVEELLDDLAEDIAGAWAGI